MFHLWCVFFICCVHNFSVMYVCVSAQHVMTSCFLLFKMQSNAPPPHPSDAWVFFLFQESRINCIRIARKGNSTWISFLPQTQCDLERIQASYLSDLQKKLFFLIVSRWEIKTVIVMALFSLVDIARLFLLSLSLPLWSTGPVFSGCLTVGLWEKGNTRGGFRGQAFILFVWGQTLGHAI